MQLNIDEKEDDAKKQDKDNNKDKETKGVEVENNNKGKSIFNIVYLFVLACLFNLNMYKNM